MSDFDNKTVLFWDASGSYTHMAEAVVGQFDRVLYYVPYETGFPTPIHFMPGYGVEGIERIGYGEDIESFWDGLDVADLVVFTDVGNGGLQEYLRSQGLPVFGSGKTGRLEQDRAYLKSICRHLGLETADYFTLRGIDSLRQFLLGGPENEPAGECYVKLSYWRGLAETFHHRAPFMTRSWLDELSLDAGPYAQAIEFLIEKPIDDDPIVEVGIDTFCADGLFPSIIMWGYEASKDNCYVGCASVLPKRLADCAEALRSHLEHETYRGPLSTETRECQKKSYVIDFTARFPEPPSSLQRFMIDNWAEIMWEVAHGRIVDADYIAPIGVQVVWKSSYGREHPLAVEVGRMDRVTIHGHTVFDGRHYAVSPAQLEEQGGAIGLGSTLEEAMEDAWDAVNSIEGRDVMFDTGFMDKINEAIQKGNELGLNWGGRHG
jgi:hypothetical protein